MLQIFRKHWIKPIPIKIKVCIGAVAGAVRSLKCHVLPPGAQDTWVVFL